MRNDAGEVEVVESKEYYLAEDNEPLAALIKEALAAGVATIATTYRASNGVLRTWASTYQRHSGWEALPDSLRALVDEMAASVISSERDGWGQIDIDTVNGEATVVGVQSGKTDIATLA